MDNESAVMRQQMDETAAGLSDKLKDLEQRVSGTVRSVTDSVNTVIETFDLKLYVRRQPWTMLAGAAALGFLGGYYSSRRTDLQGSRNLHAAYVPLTRVVAVERPFTGENPGAIEVDPSRYCAPAEPGWMASAGAKFQPEIAELKGIVIGALFGLVRDVVKTQVDKVRERADGGANNGSKQS